MEIRLTKLGKKFGQEWLFRHIDRTFKAGDTCSVVGANGSGKSTFLKIASRYMLASEGEVVYKNTTGASIQEGDVYRHISWAAPYTELIEEFTLSELLLFQEQFRPFLCDKQEIFDKLAFPKVKNKYVKHFSSGMKQKLKLALALYTKSFFLILDEPTSNLDSKNIDWYQKEMQICNRDRIVLVGSNLSYEYEFCTQSISISDFKS